MTTAQIHVPFHEGQGDFSALVGQAHELLALAIGALRPSPAEPAVPGLMRPDEVLLSLLTGGSPGLAPQLGLPVLDGRLVVVSAPMEALATLRSRALLGTRSVEAMCGAEWVVFLPGMPHTSGVDSAAREVRRLVQQLQRTGVHGWRAGVSAALASPDDLARAYRDARDALCLPGAEAETAVFADREWARLGVGRLQLLARAALPSGSPVEALLRYDETHDSTFRSSLVSWLRANGDTSSAARQLGVHPNTLRYRVRRAAEIAGIDLDDADHRLLVMLAAADT